MQNSCNLPRSISTQSYCKLQLGQIHIFRVILLGRLQLQLCLLKNTPHNYSYQQFGRVLCRWTLDHHHRDRIQPLSGQQLRLHRQLDMCHSVSFQIFNRLHHHTHNQQQRKRKHRQSRACHRLILEQKQSIQPDQHCARNIDSRLFAECGFI